MKRITACLLLTCLLLTGCSVGKKPYEPTGGALLQPTTVPVAPDTEQVEQVLTLGYHPEKALNPYTATDLSNRMLFSLLYQGLFSVDADYQVEPILCRNYSVSKDMKTYVFYLEEATFSDGTLLTAADVVASLKAARENPVYSGRFVYVSKISVTPEGAVEIKLSIAYANLPMLLDVPIVKAQDVKADWPLGTGPYYKEEGYMGVRLIRRNNWWCSASLAATASSILLMEVDSAAALRDDFEFGNITMVCADPGTDSYVDYRCDYELWGCESGVFLYLACNEKSDIFYRKSLRNALTYAIDRDSLVSEFYGDFAFSATLPASPQSPVYNQKLASEYTYDPELFIRSVQEAAPDTLRLTLLVNSADSRRIRVARRIEEMLEVAGFSVTVSALRDAEYTNALKRGNYDLHLGQTRLSPNMDLSAFYNPKGSLNFGGMADAGIYALCQEAMANEGNYYTLHQKVMTDGMLCPILFRSYAVYCQRGVLPELSPVRDNIFRYSLGKTMESARIEEIVTE